MWDFFRIKKASLCSRDSAIIISPGCLKIWSNTRRMQYDGWAPHKAGQTITVSTMWLNDKLIQFMPPNFSASEQSEWLNLNYPTTLSVKLHNPCDNVDPNCISSSKYCRKESFAFLRILVIHCLTNRIETGGTQWHCTGKTHTGSITDKDLCYQWAWLRRAKTANSSWGHPVRGEH